MWPIEDHTTFAWTVWMVFVQCQQETCSISNVAWEVYRAHGKDEHQVKWLYVTFTELPMTGFIYLLKKEHEATENCHIFIREFNDPDNKKVRDYCYFTDFYRVAAHKNCNL